MDGLEARIGVHTGLVVVGEMGAGTARLGADVVGETPNVAARLQTLAEPGQVVISGSTFALVEGFFTRRVTRRSAAQGRRSAAAGLRRARRDRRPEPSSTPFAAVVLTPLVGRDAEMGLLVRCWQAAAGGAGQARRDQRRARHRKESHRPRVARAVRCRSAASSSSCAARHASTTACSSRSSSISGGRPTWTRRPTRPTPRRRRERWSACSRRPPADAVEVIAELIEIETGGHYVTRCRSGPKPAGGARSTC